MPNPARPNISSSSFVYNAGADGTAWQLEPAQSTSPAALAGEWRLLHTNIGVTAMHMQLLPDDFVIMFDRTDSGRPSNISLLDPASRAAAPADCSAHSVLLDLRSNALHPYLLVINPWSSSAALLRNGTFLQTGGFSNGGSIARLFSRIFWPRGGGTPLTSSSRTGGCSSSAASGSTTLSSSRTTASMAGSR
ncbi:hypothetical protein ZWY2020_023894 [Hordeum vulgare]|nr:hypothetical protein ZWY2020_023894 [Hordeum vulgare]